MEYSEIVEAFESSALWKGRELFGRKIFRNQEGSCEVTFFDREEVFMATITVGVAEVRSELKPSDCKISEGLLQAGSWRFYVGVSF